MTARLTDQFGHRYLIEDAEFIDSAMFGRCVRGRYRPVARDGATWEQCGDFRLDTARSFEVVSGQMELAA